MPFTSVTAPKLPKDNSVVPDVIESKDKTVKTPLPDDISLLSKENPTTVPLAADTVYPASPAAPPEPPVRAKPETSNWKPATELPKSYKISKLPEESKAPKLKVATKHVLEPPHSPQSSNSAEPPQSPAQSNVLPSQSHAPSAIPSPLHTPHSSSAPSP